MRPSGSESTRHSAGRAVLACALVLFANAVRAQVLAPLEPGPTSYFIAEPPAAAAIRVDDPDLARWALEAWQRALGGRIEFVPAAEERSAIVRVYWAPPEGGQYGEMRPLDVAGRRGAAVFIRPDTEAFGPEIAARARVDTLFRDTIVYLTCVHELGHALGLAHTDDFEDIMYAFGFGGDIGEYFGRFRARLERRADIATAPVLAAGDRHQLERLYGAVSGGARPTDAN